MQKEKWLGWHFLREDKCLRWGTEEKVRVGKWLKVDGEPVLCKHGFHASKNILDALSYAPGPVVCQVELRGEIKEDTNKAVAQERKVLKMADATQVLHEFACWCAERALQREREQGREPDPRSWEAIKVKQRWLAGKADNDDLATAGSAAWSATESTAEPTTGSAALSATWSTSQSAAWSAAGSAAQAASAAQDTWSIERKKQDRKLRSMLKNKRRKGGE